MSLILEALKKAERQHRLGEVPGIGSSPMAEDPLPPRGRRVLSLFAVAFGMLLLGAYLGRTPPETGQVQAPEVAGLASPPAPLQSENIPPRQPATEVPEPRPEPPAILEAKARPPIEEPSGETGVEVESTPAMAEPEPVPAAEAPSAPKRMSELPDGFVSNMPKLNIDIHSFDERPGRSYVLINMEKYREGDYLAEGPLLSKILRDGVILEYMGERFILPIGN